MATGYTEPAAPKGSTLVERSAICKDESLWERVTQALKENGKKGDLQEVVAAIVLASTAVGNKAEVVSPALGKAITDDEIIAYVSTMQ